MKNIISLTLTLLLAGCDSTESELKDYMKCAISANELGLVIPTSIITRKLEKFISDSNISGSAMYSSQIADEVRNEIGVKDSSLRSRFKLIKTFNSSTCKNLHGSDGLDAPSLLYYLYYPFI